MNMKLFRKVLTWILSFPNTIFFNFYFLPFRTAIKLPVFVDFRTRFNQCHKGTVDIVGVVKTGMIKFGWGYGSNGIECNRYSYWGIRKNCKVIFNGKAHFAKGVSLRADNDGSIIFGSNFSSNQNFFCASNTTISFGHNVVLGWNVHVRDGDGHDILNAENDVINNDRPISVGNDVWLGSYASILKGVVIGNNCVIGFRSVVTRPFSENNVIIAGIPAVIVKRNIDWKR